MSHWKVNWKQHTCPIKNTFLIPWHLIIGFPCPRFLDVTVFKVIFHYNVSSLQMLEFSFFYPKGQNVGSAAHSKDRGWKQLWCVDPGRDSRWTQDSWRRSSILSWPNIEVCRNDVILTRMPYQLLLSSEPYIDLLCVCQITNLFHSQYFLTVFF